METGLKIRLRATATVSPTEDRAKVLTAVRNALGECAQTIEEGEDVQVVSHDLGCLRKIHDQLRDRHVRDAARRLMLRLREGDRLIILLNRQAAFAGVISVITSQIESPLGPIRLEIEAERPEELVDWFTLH